MNKFKVGDRVKYTSDMHTKGYNNPLWGGEHGYIGGIITSAYPGRCMVNWDNGGENSYSDNDLELLDEKPEKAKLTARGKKVVEDYFLGKGKWKIEDGELRHGDRVSCDIYNHRSNLTYHISDAMISIDSGENYNICHNIKECIGHEAEDLCGYEFSWAFKKTESSKNGVTNIKKI